MPVTNKGGKRLGAGRKAGLPIRNAAQLAGLEAGRKAFHPAPERLPEGFTAKPEQELAALMVAKGVPFTEVCRRLEKNTSTLWDWRQQPWWPVLLDKYMHELAGDPNAGLRPLTPRAIGTYEKVIDGYLEEDKEPGLAVKVAGDTMDRVWGKPLIRTQSQSQKDIRILIQEIGSDDIIDWNHPTVAETDGS